MNGAIAWPAPGRRPYNDPGGLTDDLAESIDGLATVEPAFNLVEGADIDEGGGEGHGGCGSQCRSNDVFFSWIFTEPVSFSEGRVFL